MSCGPALTALRDLVNTGTDKAFDDAKAQIALLQQLVELRLQNFYDTISKDNVDMKVIPIDKVLSHKAFYAATYENKDEIGPLISTAITEFTSAGPASAAIGKLAQNIFRTLLGSASASGNGVTEYTINISPSGAITRLDGYFYAQSVTASALVSKKATVLGCMVVESSAKVSDLDKNTLKALLAKSFSNMPPDLQLAMYAQIAPEILKTQGDEPKINPPTEEEKKALADWFKHR